MAEIPEDLKRLYEEAKGSEFRVTMNQVCIELIERITSLRAQLKTVLDRETALTFKYDELRARTEKAEAQPAVAQKPVTVAECAEAGLLSYWDHPQDQADRVTKLIASRGQKEDSQ